MTNLEHSEHAMHQLILARIAGNARRVQYWLTRVDYYSERVIEKQRKDRNTGGVEMNITVNGSRWSGQQPDTIDNLISLLSREPLDPRFEDCGNFCYPSKQGLFRVAGNFFNLSHVFQIDGTLEELQPLITGIRNNQATNAYLHLKEGMK